jgi:hypothetical protein
MRRLVQALKVLTLGGILIVPAAQSGISVTFLPASDYNVNTAAMYATLGITGDTIDTFETTTLIPGLSITLSGGVTTTTLTALANVYDENTSVCGSLGVGAWDGTGAAINSPTNQLNSCSVPTGLAALTTFNYAPGTTFFGIALTNFQSVSPASPAFPITNHELFVNGVDEGTVESLAGSNWTPGITRNAYLILTASGGSSITSVGFENLNGTTDFLAFDTLAVAAPTTAETPEPTTLSLAFVGTFLLWRGWHRRK